MAVMETIKFVLFYGMEIVVVAVIGVVLFAALYQFVQGKLGAQSKVKQDPIHTTEKSPDLTGE